MAYPKYPEVGKIRQGGDSWLQLFLQKDQNTPVKATDLATRPVIEKVTRQFTNFGVDVDGDRLASEAVRGTIDRARGQAGQRWAAGPIETEVYMNNMLTYIQAGIAADRTTDSTDVADTTVMSSESVTPDAANYVRTVGKSGSTPTPDITVTKQPSDPGNTTDVSMPKQLHITVSAPSGKQIPANYWVKIEGLRKTGLGPYDVEAISETLTQATAGQTLEKVLANVHKDDYYFDSITALVFKDKILDGGSEMALTVTITGTTTGAFNETAGVDYGKRTASQKKTIFHETQNIFDSWTLLGSTGGQPRLAFGLIPTTMRLQMGDLNRLLMETQTGLGWRNRTLVGGFLEKRENFDLTNADASKQDTTHPDHTNGFPFIENIFYPGQLGALEITEGSDTGSIIYNNMEIVINNALTFIEGVTGSPHRGVQVRDAADRTIDLSFTAYIEDPDAPPYTNPSNAPPYVDWEELFFEGQTIKATAWNFYWDSKGKQYYHKVTLGTCQVGSISQQTVDNKGSLQQTLPPGSYQRGD